MNCNAEGIALIKRFEGCELTPYEDAAGNWSVGWGHKILSTESDLMRGIDPEEAESLFQMDLAVAARAVEKYTDVALTGNQASALISWTFNLGGGTYKNSTLRTLVNEKRFRDAADEFPKWCHAAGKVLPGLVARRAAERALFLKADTSAMDV